MKLVIRHPDGTSRILFPVTFSLYRKKPLVIQACQIDEEFEVETLEGTMRGNPGDWLIKGVKGEVYPCADDIFRATYEPCGDNVDEEDSTASCTGRSLLDRCLHLYAWDDAPEEYRALSINGGSSTTWVVVGPERHPAWGSLFWGIRERGGTRFGWAEVFYVRGETVAIFSHA